MAERPNFYILLEIGSQEGDWNVIEARIREKRELWARESSMGNPRARSEAKRNLGLLPEIKRVLADPTLRCKEADEAERIRRAARGQKEKELLDRIEVLRSTGICSQEQLRQLLWQFDSVFSQAELEARLAAAGVPVQRTEDPTRPRRKRESIDSTRAQSLRRLLGQLGLGSLYDLLGMSPASKAEDLRRRADELYRENQRLGRIDPASSTVNELTGECQVLFRSEAEKAKYDDFLLLEAMGSLRDQIELAGADRVIAPAEMETLIRLATQRGISAEDAEEFVESYAEEKGWAVQTAPPPPVDPAPTHAEALERAAASSPPSPGVRRRTRAVSLLAGSLAASAAALLLVKPPGGLNKWLPASVSSPLIPLAGAPAGGALTPTTRPASANPATTLPPASTGSAAGRPSATAPIVPLVTLKPRPDPTPAIPAIGPAAGSPPASIPPSTAPERGKDTALSAAATLPDAPTVAVIALGDPLLAQAVEQRLEHDLRDGGLDIGDEHGSLHLNDRLHRDGADLDVPSVLPILARDGFHVLVLARIERLGERELSYFGRKDTAFQARLRVHAFRVTGERSLGSGWSETLEYTALDAAPQAEQALQSFTGDLIQAIQNGWTARR